MILSCDNHVCRATVKMCHTGIKVIVDLHRASPSVSGGKISPHTSKNALCALVCGSVYVCMSHLIHDALCSSRWWHGDEASCSGGEPCSGSIDVALASSLHADVSPLVTGIVCTWSIRTPYRLSSPKCSLNPSPLHTYLVGIP